MYTTHSSPCLFCYWATSELEINQTWLAEKLKISQPAVSLAVKLGDEKVKFYKLMSVP